MLREPVKEISGNSFMLQQQHAQFHPTKHSNFYWQQSGPTDHFLCCGAERESARPGHAAHLWVHSKGPTEQGTKTIPLRLGEQQKGTCARASLDLVCSTCTGITKRSPIKAPLSNIENAQHSSGRGEWNCGALTLVPVHACLGCYLLCDLARR